MDVEWVALGEVHVEEAAAEGGGAGDEVAVLRGEEYGGDEPEERLEGWVGGGVVLYLFVFSVEEDAHRLADAFTVEERFEEEEGSAFADELGKLLRPKGAPRAEESNRFEEICLPLSIQAIEDVCLRTEMEVQFFNVTEVTEIETSKHEVMLTKFLIFGTVKQIFKRLNEKNLNFSLVIFRFCASVRRVFFSTVGDS